MANITSKNSIVKNNANSIQWLFDGNDQNMINNFFLKTLNST